MGMDGKGNSRSPLLLSLLTVMTASKSTCVANKEGMAFKNLHHSDSEYPTMVQTGLPCDGSFYDYFSLFGFFLFMINFLFLITFLLQSCDTLDTDAGFQEEPKRKKTSSCKFFQRKDAKHKDTNGLTGNGSESKKDSDAMIIQSNCRDDGVLRRSSMGVVEEKSPVVPNGIYCTSFAFYQERPETAGVGERASCDPLLSAERVASLDVEEVEQGEEKEEKEEKEAKSCEEYNLQIVSHV